MNFTKRAGRICSIAAMVSLAGEPFVPLLAAQTQPQSKPAAQPAPKPATTPPATTAPATTTPAQAGAKPPLAAVAAATNAPVDGGWPRMYNLASGGSMLLYQPQISSWDKQKDLVAFSAVSYRNKAGDKPAMGTIKIETSTKVALQERLVSMAPLKIVEANFTTLAKEQVREITEQIDKAFPPEERVIALDRVLANLDKSTIVPKTVEGIKADPPTIFFSKTPAVIVNLDGDAIWSPIKENDLKYAVNTNWDLFLHEPT